VPLIFVSYRRQDTQSATGRLCDKLQLHFDAAQVFHDIESIEPGADFAATIAAKVSSSTVVLVMIGPRWLESIGTDGRRRLEDPGDYVRLEVATALRRRIPVIPVLVEGATMPSASALPDVMRALAQHQAHEISEQRWQYDSDLLVQELEKFVAPDREGTEVAPTLGGALLRSVIGYPADFVRLLVRPRRQLLARLKPPDVVARAVVFFVMSHLVAAWLFVFEDLVASVPAFVLYGVPMGAFNLLLVVIPLHLAARIVRAPSHAPSTMVVVAYLSSVFTTLVAAGAAALWSGLELGAPSIGPAMREALYADLPLDVRIMRLSDVIQPAIGGPFFAGFALTILIWLYAAGWLAIASSAIRDMWRISGLRALAVLILFAMMMAFVVGFVAIAAWIGSW
jgi:hypothetical protein